MDPKKVRLLLEQVRDGELEIERAIGRLSNLPFEDLGFAKVDHHRQLRTGFPEVVMGEGKTADQLVEIFQSLRKGSSTVLATRVDAERAEHLARAIPEVEYHPTPGLALLRRAKPTPIGIDPVLVITAGTSDLPVAQEAVVTAEVFGNRVETLYDVGVAGIQRLLAHRELIERAGVLIVVAGMEAALASVVAGLVSRPIIAVPTSVGYGANFGGLAALLGLMNSCAAGVTVVNIDNGFGAGVAASMIQRAIAA